ncbi:hypothetical protein DYB25_003543 [Aphanomyces astaci]|uniref:DDE-1 domain-containing protein n=1 Tax=Aphanomyces astaci TaxID=112090 RepID=A0A397E818_APHAT|nr:hypothetical protein DYB25_003543 [Aphanomyces astaci]RHY75654.1 hypothetical protein DYB30_013344 [Aphanomyces astaci]RHY84535.1 hypothetical protein DYB26_015172 [Aphanomyces astaci]RHY90139.1 hypothetical protein DYB35_008513 [Aphanomyces astaci]RHY99980.1 hypothetical protein DYB31_014564 [Aphanomyces astaci]
MPRRCHKSYTIGEKRKFLALFEQDTTSSREFCATHDIPRSTWIGWQQSKEKLTGTIINAKRKTFGGQGAQPSIPFKNEMLSFMKDVRRDEHILTSMHMITFMKTYHAAWLADYKLGKRDPYKSLLKLCQDFARRHNFSQRVPCFTKIPSVDMVALRNDFAAQFWNKYDAYEQCDILNVDETGVNYDMPPGKIWAEKGKSSKVDKTQKHSDRLTAVLTCRANGTDMTFFVLLMQ